MLLLLFTARRFAETAVSARWRFDVPGQSLEITVPAAEIRIDVPAPSLRIDPATN